MADQDNPLAGLEAGIQADFAGDGKPKDYSALYAEAAKKWGIEPELLRAVIQQESSEGAHQFNWQSGAAGPAQLMPGTAKELGVSDPYAPEQAIPAAAQYLRQNMDHFQGDPGKAIAGYYAGPNGRFDTPEVQKYVGEVQAKYQRLKGGGGAQAQAPTADDPLAGLSKQIQDDFNNPDTTALANRQLQQRTGPLPAEQPGPDWGMGAQTGDAALLGGGVAASAAAMAAEQALHDLRGGASLEYVKSKLPDYYAQAKAHFAQAQENWEKDNPGKAIVGDLAGSTPTTMLATGGIGTLAAKGTEAVLGSGPLVRGAIDFIAGRGGAEGSGFMNWLTRQLPSMAVRGAAEGATTGLVQSGMNDTPTEDQVKLGTAIGTAVGVVGAPLGALARVALLGRIDPNVARAALRAVELGVDVRPGQVAMGHSARAVDSALASSGNEAQLGQFTRAASRTFGEDSDRLTPEVMDAARVRIGREFENISRNMTIHADPRFVADLGNIRNAASVDAMSDAAKAQVRSLYNRIGDQLALHPTGDISGEVYQEFTRHGGAVDNFIKSPDPFLRDYGLRFRTALDDAMERSVPPQLRQELQDARLQWKNLMAVQPLAEKAQPTGFIDPALLQNRVQKAFSDYGWGQPTTLGELGEVGKMIARPEAQGGAKESAAHGWLHRLSGPAAVGAGYEMLHEPNALAATVGIGAGALLAKRIGGGMLKSPGYRDLMLGAGAEGLPPLDYLGLGRPEAAVANRLYNR